LINPALVGSESARKRFIREGLLARDIRHPSIIAMYDVAESNDKQVYLVMEYLSGQTLRQWMHQKKVAKEEVAYNTARDLIRNILEGLDAAHNAGVIHRDLKPENIVLMGDPEKGDCRLKILDFGIARAVGADAKQLTTTGSSSGTMGYMAPEQIGSADTAGPSADIYSVTAIFYELLMEVVPRAWPGSLAAQRSDLPPALDGVIEKGLKDRPRSRYQGAKEYLAALDAIHVTGTDAPKATDAPKVADALKVADAPKIERAIAKAPAPNQTH